MRAFTVPMQRVMGLMVIAGLVVSAVPVWAVDTRGMTLDQRLSRLERMLDNQNMAELVLGLEHLRQEVASLRGEVEVQAHLLKGLRKQQKELYLDLDQRLQQLEMAASSPPEAAAEAVLDFADIAADTMADGSEELPAAAAGEPSAAAALGESSAAGQTGGFDEAEAYQRAFDLLKAGDYAAARQAFEDFLASYPQGGYADNAQYWLGEVHYVSRRFQQAAEEFGKVIERYPESPKVADALLKLGFSYYELKQWQQANDVLTRVISQYPSSTAARLAERRLQQMKLEGRI